MNLNALICLSTAAFIGLFPMTGFTAPEPVQLDRIEHTAAELTVTAADGTEVTYDSERLEQLPTYRLLTTTPWRDEAANFEGVLLRDLLKAHNLADAAEILVTAENDYTVTIPRQIWMELDVLVATRVNGAPHSRRARGPIQFVIDMDSYQNHAAAREDHLVWMAARIEPVK